MSGKLLIIDDEEWYFEPIFERLNHENINYDFCKTGASGLNRLMNQNKTEYAAIILDMKLPIGKVVRDFANKFDVPGLFILQKIRELNKSIPILCYTVLSDAETKKEILKFDAKHIVKAHDSMEVIFNEIHNIFKNT